MKVFDSGMPDESHWNRLFDVPGIIDWLALPKGSTVVEIGCGYGTFTVPVSCATDSAVVAFDIDPSMIDVTSRNLLAAGLTSGACMLRDVLAQGTGLDSESVDAVLLFNILHSNERSSFIGEASRILKADGIIAIIHWRKDVPTPRGPAHATRPDVDQIVSASAAFPLSMLGDSVILEPFHWGMKLAKTIA